MREDGLDGLSHMQYTNFLSLSDNESVILSPVIIVHTLSKKREIKTVPVFTRIPSSLVPWCSLNELNGWGRQNISILDFWDGCTQKEGDEKLLKYRERER